MYDILPYSSIRRTADHVEANIGCARNGMTNRSVFPYTGLLVATIVAAGGVYASYWIAIGPLSHHMLVHILLMNILAPVIALSAEIVGNKGKILPTSPIGIGILQIAALWAAHSPAAVTWATTSAGGSGLIHATLFLLSILFWMVVFAQRGPYRWRSLLMLLGTGKLFCLLGALLVFAPRVLYPELHRLAHTAEHSGLRDQQLAGLLMIAACPLTYVLAAVVIAAKWISDVSAKDRTPSYSRPAQVI